MSYGWKECDQRLGEVNAGWLSRWISCLAVALDFRIRIWDFNNHRSWGGKLSRWTWLARNGQPTDGHAPLAFLLPAFLGVFVVFGPKPFVMAPWVMWQYALGATLLVAAWGALILIFRRWHEQSLFWAQICWLIALCGVVWVTVWVLEHYGLSLGKSPVGEARALEATDALYHHVLLKLIPTVLLPVILLAKLLSWSLVVKVPTGHRTELRKGLSRTELFVRPEYPRVTLGGVAMSAISAILYRFVLLLYMPSLFLVMVIAPVANKDTWTAIVAFAWFFIVLLVELHPRLDAVSIMLKRMLFTGGQLVVSLLVIVLGIGRFFEIQYISAVVESSAGQVVFLFILAAYTFFWFSEYWINRLMGEQLIELLRAEDDPVRRAGQATYRFKPESPAEDAKTGVPHQGRLLQVHGGARLVALYQPEDRLPLFQLYERLDLFRQICRGAPADVFADIRKRLRFYFSVLNLASILMVWAAGSILFAGPQLAQHPQEPGRAATEIAQEKSADLRKLVFEDGAGEDVLLLAASGGGTRAAMYTTAVLRGLAELDELHRLKLASGVSGGGAALAYYAGHLDELRKAAGKPLDHDAWKQFQCTMDDPFILDVIDGAGEGRIFGETRLGQLLAESFERRFDDGGKTFGDIGTEFGLILNTAVAGALRVPECPEGEAFRDCAYEWRNQTRGSKKGSRLVFTNLDRREAFPGLQNDRPVYDPLRVDRGINFSYEVVRDENAELTTAAALNANFPPVFTNAAVDLEEKRMRYWVTDGGAVENRGVLSLLFALRDAAVRRAEEAKGHGPQPVPRVHVLVVEASAVDTDYLRFPGLSSVFGAPSKIGSQLMKDLMESVLFQMSNICQCDAKALGLLDIHYLGMPGPLRVDGGLGTHWMLHKALRLGDPHECDPGARTGQVIDGLAARNLIYELFLEESDRAMLECPDDARDVAGDEIRRDAEIARVAILRADEADGCWKEDWKTEWDRLVGELAQGVPRLTVADGADGLGKAAK